MRLGGTCGQKIEVNYSTNHVLEEQRCMCVCVSLGAVTCSTCWIGKREFNRSLQVQGCQCPWASGGLRPDFEGQGKLLSPELRLQASVQLLHRSLFVDWYFLMLHGYHGKSCQSALDVYFYYGGKIFISIKLLQSCESVQLGGINYLHSIIQPPFLLLRSKTSLSPQAEPPYLLSSHCPFPSSLSPWQP